jgi:hypothetical protein
LKISPQTRPHQKVQVRADVCKVVNANVEPTRHVAKRAAHRTIVTAKGSRAFGPVARQHDVHRSSCAHGALALATPTPHVTPVLESPQLTLQLLAKKRQLHRNDLTIARSSAMS